MIQTNLLGRKPTQQTNMKTIDQYGQAWNAVPDATHLVVVDDQGATMLCEAHTNAMQHTLAAAAVPVEIYLLPPDEEPIACQACHLVEVNRPKIILH
jgi:hypothetical protein